MESAFELICGWFFLDFESILIKCSRWWWWRWCRQHFIQCFRNAKKPKNGCREKTNSTGSNEKLTHKIINILKMLGTLGVHHTLILFSSFFHSLLFARTHSSCRFICGDQTGRFPFGTNAQQFTITHTHKVSATESQSLPEPERANERKCLFVSVSTL